MFTLLGSRKSNWCATVEPSAARAALMLLVLVFTASGVAAQTADGPTTMMSQPSHDPGRWGTAGRFVAGAFAGLAAHEGGHLVFDYAFDADPRIKRVEFHGIPFFAITHRPDLSARRELIVSSAGFWIQHAGSEWILTRQPRLREQRAAVQKGMLAFNVATSMAYAGAAFARTGPAERDTRGIAVSAGIDERWVGAMILAPAALDAVRYFDPDARWAAWLSRGMKVGFVLLVFR